MNWKFAIVLLSVALSFTSYSQKYIRYADLGQYERDSVRAIEITKQKWKEFPQELLEYKNLEHLIISKVPLAKLDGLEKMTQLKSLKLDKIDLAYFPIEVTQLTNLTSLTLSRIEFSNIPKQIERLSNLEFLDLYGCVITSLPDEIENVTTLKRLDLSGVSLNAQEQKAIKEKLPNVKIRMDAPCNCMSH